MSNLDENPDEKLRRFTLHSYFSFICCFSKRKTYSIPFTSKKKPINKTSIYVGVVELFMTVNIWYCNVYNKTWGEGCLTLTLFGTHILIQTTSRQIMLWKTCFIYSMLYLSCTQKPEAVYFLLLLNKIVQKMFMVYNICLCMIHTNI